MILPLFPGYLFTSFDRSTGQWAEINRMIGVSKLLGYDVGANTICAMRDGVVPGLQQFLDDEGLIDMTKAFPAPDQAFLQGDAVKILSGMFEGKTATYWNQTRNGAMLILSLLNRPVRVILRNEEITRG